MDFPFRFDDATNLITLYNMLHPDCQSAREAKQRGLQGLDLIKVYYTFLALNNNFER